MFWGLIMESNKRYTQTVEKPFHISQAAMDTSTGDSEPCQVMVVVDGKNFLICTLQKGRTIQVPLDLYFKTGTVVSFLTNGKCNVHLTGYLDPEYDEEEESEDDEEDEAPELVPAKNKRKLDSSTESATKKLKEETKKQLKQQLNVTQDSDDSSDDEGANDLQKLLDGDVDSDENDESFRPNSTGGDSEEESGEEDEAEAEEEESPDEAEADTSKEEEPKQLSKAQRRREKKKQQKLQQKLKELPQTNGVEKKKKDQQPQQAKKQKGEKQQSESPEKKERADKPLAGGVKIEDLQVGSGPEAKPGKQVEVYYEGRLKSSNKMFDHCKKGPGFRFRIGQKEVISGWDVGVAGMKVGGKRKIVCPPNMAYGAKGSPPVIPPNSTLVFEVELRKVK